ncbi:hypothetical protein RAA17_09475 [Komagataeibacter rhaeticus]|nr:hypothetical protein [Komagataeibacter rhaeticus]
MIETAAAFVVIRDLYASGGSTASCSASRSSRWVNSRMASTFCTCRSC